MFTHLQTREYYEDLYDKWTVESCRRMASFEPEIKDEDFAGEKLTSEQLEKMKEIRRQWSGVAAEMATFTYAAERYTNKDRFIGEWMQKDRERDERLARIQPPEHVRCRECLSTNLQLISKDEHESAKPDYERVLFMYRCGDCGVNTAYFDNGEQFRTRPVLCPECMRPKPEHSTKESKHKYTITYTCTRCGHEWKEVVDFTSSPPEPPDPDYIKDRKLYCYSDKVRGWAEDIQRIGPLMGQFKERQVLQKKADEVRDELSQIKKLTILQLHERLKIPIEKAGYTEVSFTEPELGRDAIVGFSCLDAKSERGEYDSRNTLKKAVTKALANTNWRLMSDGVSYRLGYLNGRLRAYEREEDLVELLRRSKKQRG
jgi:DNA-directed RNA polymerase subunit RPC12/RpoP